VAPVTPIVAAIEPISVHFDPFPDVGSGEGTEQTISKGGDL